MSSLGGVLFSKACQYAIKVMIFMATKKAEDRRIGLSEISVALNSPKAFTAKVLQQLVKGKLLESIPGPNGGFILSGKKDVIIYDIVELMDGDRLLEECVLGLKHCSSANPCPVHHQFVDIRTQMKETLMRISINDPEVLAGHLKLLE